MRNLGIFPSKPWLTHLFHPSPSYFFTCPFVVSLSPLTFLPLLSILHWAVYIPRTGSYVQLASSSSMLRPATHIYMTTTPIHVLSMSIKNILDACFTLYYLNGCFTAFYHHASGCLTPCKHTKFSEPGSWITYFSLFESPFLLHWVICGLSLIVDWILFLSLFLLLLFTACTAFIF